MTALCQMFRLHFYFNIHRFGSKTSDGSNLRSPFTPTDDDAPRWHCKNWRSQKRETHQLGYHQISSQQNQNWGAKKILKL